MPDNVQNLHSEAFGSRVQSARSSRGLTQAEAADLLGMSRRKLIDIEAGRIELPRYQKTGVLAVLAGHYEDTIEQPPAADLHLVGRMDGCSQERFSHLNDGTPVVLCGVMLDLQSGDHLGSRFRSWAKELKARREWPDYMNSIRTVVFQFDHFRERLAQIQPLPPS